MEKGGWMNKWNLLMRTQIIEWINIFALLMKNDNELNSNAKRGRKKERSKEGGRAKTDSLDRVEISGNQSINTIYRRCEDVGWKKKLSAVKLNFSIINRDRNGGKPGGTSKWWIKMCPEAWHQRKWGQNHEKSIALQWKCCVFNVIHR